MDLFTGLYPFFRAIHRNGHQKWTIFLFPLSSFAHYYHIMTWLLKAFSYEWASNKYVTTYRHVCAWHSAYNNPSVTFFCFVVLLWHYKRMEKWHKQRESARDRKRKQTKKVSVSLHRNSISDRSMRIIPDSILSSSRQWLKTSKHQC